MILINPIEGFEPNNEIAANANGKLCQTSSRWWAILTTGELIFVEDAPKTNRFPAEFCLPLI
jgi:hypothetical protein